MNDFYVYFEHVLIINLILNSIILWSVAKAIQLKVRKKRLLLGALAGATYSFMLLVPYLGIAVNMVTKFLMSLLMIFITFGPLKPKKFVHGVITLYLITFLLGGTIFGLGYFTEGSGVLNYFLTLNMITENLFYIFITAVLLYLLLGKFIHSLFKQNLIQGLLKTAITIKLGQKALKLEALLDTGNNLRDPLSNLPVIIVEQEALKSLIPKEFNNFDGLNPQGLNQIFDSCSDSLFAARVRVIPFKSLGEDNGLLLGFRPEMLTIHKGGNEIRTSQVLIGIYNQKLSPSGNYKALLHPDLMY